MISPLPHLDLEPEDEKKTEKSQRKGMQISTEMIPFSEDKVYILQSFYFFIRTNFGPKIRPKAKNSSPQEYTLQCEYIIHRKTRQI